MADSTMPASCPVYAESVGTSGGAPVNDKARCYGQETGKSSKSTAQAVNGRGAAKGGK